MKWHEVINFCKDCQEKYGDNAEAFILFENEKNLDYCFFSDVNNPNSPCNEADRVMAIFLGLLTVEDNTIFNSVVCASALEAIQRNDFLALHALYFQKHYKERYFIKQKEM